MTDVKIALGLQPSPPGPHYRAADYLSAPMSLPDTIDYFERSTPVRYQQDQPECAGFATGKNLEWHNHGEYPTYLSPQWAYKLGKDRDGWDGPGTSFWAILQGCRSEGICLEEDWPFENRWPPSSRPGPAATDHAAMFKIETYAQVTRSEIHIALAAFGPLLIGVRVHDTFVDTPATGIIPYPGGRYQGGHGMDLRFSDLTDRIFPGGVCGGWNSWSARWGKLGRWFIPYRYLAEIHTETWSVVDVKGILLRWPDLAVMNPSDDDMLSQDKVWQRGAMRGFEDGTFGVLGEDGMPRPVTQHQLGNVLANLGLAKTNPFNDDKHWVTQAQRGWVHEKFPQLKFLEENRWSEVLTRYQLLVLVGRYLRGV